RGGREPLLRAGESLRSARGAERRLHGRAPRRLGTLPASRELVADGDGAALARVHGDPVRRRAVRPRRPLPPLGRVRSLRHVPVHAAGALGSVVCRRRGRRSRRSWRPWVAGVRGLKMTAFFLLLLLPVVAFTLLASADAAHAAAVAPTKLMARCTKLYGLWFRYEQHPTYHHTGQRAQAELALYG